MPPGSRCHGGRPARRGATPAARRRRRRAGSRASGRRHHGGGRAVRRRPRRTRRLWPWVTFRQRRTSWGVTNQPAATAGKGDVRDCTDRPLHHHRGARAAGAGHRARLVRPVRLARRIGAVMTAAYVLVTAAAAAANALIAAADLLRARFVLDNSAAVGVPESWLLPLGLLQAAGATGLLLGLVGVPVIGVAAGIGLVLFFVGAVVTHVRARNYDLAFPLVFLLLAVGSVALYPAR